MAALIYIDHPEPHHRLRSPFQLKSGRNAHGTKRTWLDVGLESAIEGRAEIDFGPGQLMTQIDHLVTANGLLMP